MALRQIGPSRCKAGGVNGCRMSKGHVEEEEAGDSEYACAFLDARTRHSLFLSTVSSLTVRMTICFSYSDGCGCADARYKVRSTKPSQEP